MIAKEFFRRISNSKGDVIQELQDMLEAGKIPYCVIGGLGVNAYAEPVLTLDCDIVIASDRIKEILPEFEKKGYRMAESEHSINLYPKDSDLRIRFQTDEDLQSVIPGAQVKDVIGYKLPAADIRDLFAAKLKAAQAPDRRPSKREKDYADLLRLIEVKDELKELLPDEIKKDLKIDS